MTKKQKKPLELYIHIPFCARKCLYCDFLSFRTLAAVHEAYVDQLIREIEAEGASCQEYPVVTVFIGGGTPEPCCRTSSTSTGPRGLTGSASAFSPLTTGS